jgi:putative FmdB family regulatory protein
MLYEYACYWCNKIYEIQKPVQDFSKEVKCPHCDRPLEIHICPVRFKING